MGRRRQEEAQVHGRASGALRSPEARVRRTVCDFPEVESQAPWSWCGPGRLGRKSQHRAGE